MSFFSTVISTVRTSILRGWVELNPMFDPNARILGVSRFDGRNGMHPFCLSVPSIGRGSVYGLLYLFPSLSFSYSYFFYFSLFLFL